MVLIGQSAPPPHGAYLELEAGEGCVLWFLIRLRRDPTLIVARDDCHGVRARARQPRDGCP